jgi:predicted nucleotidyltransferase
MHINNFVKNKFNAIDYEFENYMNLKINKINFQFTKEMHPEYDQLAMDSFSMHN